MLEYGCNTAKKAVLAFMLIVSAGLCGCSMNNEKEEQKTAAWSTQKNSEEAEPDDTVESSVSETKEMWETAYINILNNMENNLTDIYNLRTAPNEYFYIGIHDFDSDGIPELVAGDSVSAAIFTCKNGEAEKIVDLYEPEERGGINGLYYKDNNVILVSDGSGGSGYVCFTYDKGAYLSGIYDDYEPDKATINEIQVTEEEFRQQFNLSRLLENSRIEYVRMENENTLVIADEKIATDNLNFDLIEW